MYASGTPEPGRTDVLEYRVNFGVGLLHNALAVLSGTARDIERIDATGLTDEREPGGDVLRAGVLGELCVRVLHNALAVLSGISRDIERMDAARLRLTRVPGKRDDWSIG